MVEVGRGEDLDGVDAGVGQHGVEIGVRRRCSPGRSHLGGAALPWVADRDHRAAGVLEIAGHVHRGDVSGSDDSDPHHVVVCGHGDHSTGPPRPAALVIGRGWRAGIAVRCRTGPELVLDHLPGGVPGQGVDEVPPPGHLVAGEELQGVLAELVGSRLHTRTEGHEGHDVLAEDRVLDADHGHLVDGRVRLDGVLDVGRVDVVAAPDDDVLAPPDDVEVAVLVEAAEVAGDQPAVDPGPWPWPPGRRSTRAGRPGIRIRTWPTSPAATGRPVVVDADDLGRWQRLADRAGPAHRLAGWHEAVDRSGLGHAVVVGDQGGRHPLLQPLEHLGGERCAADRAELDRAQVGRCRTAGARAAGSPWPGPGRPIPGARTRRCRARARRRRTGR